MTRRTLSVCIIAFNEEAVLARCLASVAFADEIILVDSGSQDATRRLARQAGARVFERTFEGFGAQKQYAVDQAQKDWILSIDADEWVSEELRSHLQALLTLPEEQVWDGYRIFRRNHYLGRPMRYCGWYHPILRLFRRGRGGFNQKLVHEEIVVEGSLGVLAGDLMHAPYRDLSHQLEKMRRYVPLDAQELDRSGRRVRGWTAPVHLVGRPAWKFVEKYVKQQGFREGLHGFILSALASIGVFMIHAECWRLQAEAVPPSSHVQDPPASVGAQGPHGIDR